MKALIAPRESCSRIDFRNAKKTGKFQNKVQSKSFSVAFGLSKEIFHGRLDAPFSFIFRYSSGEFMPAIPLNKTNAWAAWVKGRITGTNVFLDVVEPSTTFNGYSIPPHSPSQWIQGLPSTHRLLASLASKQAYNAVRLWITSEIYCNGADMANIANGVNGWAATTSLASHTLNGVTTVIQLRDRIRAVLDECASLGLGVILVAETPNSIPVTLPDTTVINYSLLTPPNTASNDTFIINKAHQVMGDFWAKCVNEWGKHPALIGIDLLNEPKPISLPAPTGSQTSITAYRAAAYSWTSLAQTIIKAIRAQENLISGLSSPTPIIVEGFGGDASALRIFDAPSPAASSTASKISPTYLYDNGLDYSKWSTLVSGAGASGWIVYSFHDYGVIPVSLQGVDDYMWGQLGWEYPAGKFRYINRYFNSAGNFIEEDVESVGEGWGHNIQTFNDSDDTLARWSTALDLKTHAETAASGKIQPLYLGEFSFVQPVLEDVNPPNPERVNLTWEASTTHVPAAAVVKSDSEGRKYWPKWTDRANHHKSRWITEFEVFIHPTTGKKWVRAYFDNLSRWSFGRVEQWYAGTAPGTRGPIIYPPTPPVPSPVPTGYTDRSNLTTTQARNPTYEIGFPVVMTREAPPSAVASDPLQWPNTMFHNDVLMTVTAGEPGTSAFVVTKVNVTLTADTYWAEYESPDQSVTVSSSVRRQALTGPTGAQSYPAVALATFFSAKSGATMENSRANFVHDVLYAAQFKGISWTYYSDVGGYGGFIGWRTSAQMEDKLRQAALGRKLLKRT